MSPTESHVKQWLAKHASIEPDLLQRPSFDRLIQDRLEELGISDQQGYCQILDRDLEERERVIRAISVNETWFFRYPASFELLVRHLRSLHQRRGDSSTLAMLSIACASGEEPYSMVMAAARAEWTLRHVSVDAVDRDARTLETAQRAVYPRRALREDAPDWASRWLARSGDRWRVDPRISTRVRFLHADILTLPDADLQSSYDVVFCRNLMIYLHQPARQTLADRLRCWLSRGGLLFVGHAEQLECLRVRFRWVDAAHAFAMRSDVPALETRANHGHVVMPSSPGHASVAPMSAALVPKYSEREQLALPPQDSTPISASAESRQRATDHSPSEDSSESTLQEARALADAGRLGEALKLLQRSMAREASGAEAFALLGSIQLGLGNMDSARQALSKALYFNPRHEACLLQLALIHRQLGDESLASRYQQRAARADQSARQE